MAYKPDLIIVYDGWNDVYYSRYTPERYLQQYQSTSRLLRKWNHLSFKIIRASDFMKAAVFSRNKLKRLFDKPLYAAEPPEDILEVSWMGGVTQTKIGGDIQPQDIFSDIYQRNLTAMADTAGQAGVPVLFILQPSLSTVGLQKGFNEAGQKTLDTFKPMVREDWLKTSAVLFPLAKTAQLRAREYHKRPFYDFNEEPGLQQEFFDDLVHLNPAGNRWAAGRIFEIIKKEKLIQ